MKISTYLQLGTLIFVVSCKNQEMNNTTDKLQAPIAKKVVKEITTHGDTRTDNYFWMRLSDEQKASETPDAQTQEVTNYLKAENAFFEENTKHTKTFQESLFEEMKGRIKEDDSSVPYLKNGYYYITRYEKGKQYPIYTRKKGTMDAKEELLFDVNAMAEGYDYYTLGGMSVSTDNTICAFAVDTVSRREYTVGFKNLETGEILSDKIDKTTGGVTWANDNKTVFYVKKDPVTLRSNKIYKHTIGEDVSKDVLIYEEKDETFGTYITKTKSEKFLVIGSYSTESNEHQILEANNPSGTFRMFQERTPKLEYSVAHYNGDFYILTNKDKATNFKLMKTSDTKTTLDNWTDVIVHREDVLIEDISIFKEFIVLEERNNGQNRIRIKYWKGDKDYYLPFEEEDYSAGVSYNPEFDTQVIRYSYNSMTTPSSVIDYNVADQSKTIMKEQEVMGGQFNKENYTSKRVWATARDGKKVAISLVYRKDTELNKNTPLLLYGYGSYGYTLDPYFSTTRLSLLDRGFVYAIAHIRGSEYLGREWYEDGKKLNKLNTFTDFIDCGQYLIDNKYTSSEHMYASGGSAGGLLVGAVINLAPEMFQGVIAAVPFVDVINTMLDESIPLTTGEFDEWGNPKDATYYDYIKKYSPYDNVEAKAYPNLLVTTGYHDSQVQYWEPAKWVAKLRELKTNNKQLFLHTDMETGHGGASGRFDAIKEVARDYTFILDLEGKVN